MAATGRRTGSPLTQLLFEKGFQFDFFQAVRLLERAFPESEPVARTSDPGREVVRFRSRASLGFPPSQIHEVRKNGSEGKASPESEMTVAFMGLTGPVGVLPVQYTELIMERARYRDETLWTFLDIFTHRFVSLFYRAWEKHRFPVAYERGKFDEFTQFLFDFVGLGTGGLRGRLHQRDQGLLLYSGLLAQSPRSASALSAILSDHFSVPVKVKQFEGQWLKLEPESYSLIGHQNNQLGVNTVAGTRVWDTQSKFRLLIGPMSLNRFRDFLPVGIAFKPFSALSRFFVGMAYDFDARLVLEKEEVPDCILDASNAEKGPRLGWTSWLKTAPFKVDDSQTLLQMND